jgi:predicted amidohydrolase YtcJ
VLVSGDLHCCWLNSAALARFGRAGHSTGILREDDAFAVTSALTDIPVSVLDGWVAEASAAAAARGVVGVVDFEMADNLAVWSRRMSGAAGALRVAAGIYTEHLDAAISAGHRTGDLVNGTGGLLTVGPFKILIDGSLNTRTAYCAEEYPGLAGQANSHGILTVAPAELVALLRRASGSGIMPAVHAIGDDANRIALDAFETVGCGGRIEHAQLLRDADLPRFAALGVTASVQPEQAMDDRGVADRHWAGRTGRAFPLRSLIDAGATLVLGSDAPVAPLDPWVTIAAAVGRQRDGLAAWHPEQSISAVEAVSASAHGRRRVSVGEVADLCVVDGDPFTASADALRSMPVAATMLAGRFTHNLLLD